jgi:signal transduction histidine kinase
MNWRMKAVLPVAAVLLAGLLVFVWVSLSFEPPERQAVILVAAAGAIAICAVLLAMLAILIQRPLVELQRKIAQVREGNLQAEVSFADRGDEIGQLGRDFNEMVRQFRDSREEIKRLHRTQMSRAEHLATLGELAAGLAHEIRNPLAGLAGVIEIMGKDLPASSPAKEVWKDAQQEVLRIKKILSDLLDYARPKPPEFAAADLNKTAEHAVVLARQQVFSRPIAVEFIPDPALPPVEHDASKIQQVLVNLLLNATQAIGANHEGQVVLKIASVRESAVLTVTDNGRGIAAEHLPNVFRPFFTTKGQGTGLGLSLARSIVELHGGQITVESERGRGTTFEVRLPLRKRPEA